MLATQKRPVVALFSPLANATSETFIQAHRNEIDADVRYFTDGPLPTRVNDQPIMRFKYQFQHYLKSKVHRTGGLSVEEFALRESLREHNPDVVLCEFGPTAAHSLRVVRDLGLPMLVFFHGYDISIPHMIDGNNGYADVIAYADKIFAVSRDMEKKIIGLGARPEQVVYNPCAPNDEYFKINRSTKPQQLFVAAGRLTNKKAPYITLLAFKEVLAKHPKAKLIIAGDGDLHQVCRDLAAYHGIQESVELPGAYDAAKLQGWFEQAAALVLHSVTAENGDQEGTPVVVLEALAAGLPVVSTKHAGIKDVVVDGQTGYLVDEYDIKGMAAKMSSILDSPKQATVLGLEGRKFVSQGLTMKHHIGKIDRAVYNICGLDRQQ